MAVFEEFYKALNKEQKAAVDATEGPVMVTAGPGTGKTQILTLRIANILRKTDTAPENILALTFTDAAGQNMRKRLSEIIGPLAFRVEIKTFHGFCNDIIKNYPEEFPRIIGSRHIAKFDQVSIIEKLIDAPPAGGALKILRPFGDPYLYTRSVLESIDGLKREGVNPKRFTELVRKEKKNFQKTPHLYHEKGAHKGKMKGEYQKLEKQIAKNHELSRLYFSYQKTLEKEKLYDYADMIMEVFLAVSKNKNLLLILQEEHQYILVDEHQDTNNAQNKILELLAGFHQNPNIFVVGDEKQAIFRFQGASLENFLYFKKLYPKAKLITLTENYRSSQTILDSAHSLISNLTSPQPSPKGRGSKLIAKTGHEEKPLHLLAFSSQDAENYFLAQGIKLKIDGGIKSEEIAVLYRDNKDAFPIARMLEKFNIPHSIESDQELFSDPDVRKIIILLKTINNYGEDEYLAEALHLDFLNINPLEVYKLIRRSHNEKKNLYDLLDSPPPVLPLIKGEVPKAEEVLRELAKKFSRWARLAKNENLLKVFETVFEESGMLRTMMAGGSISGRLETINAFFDELKGIVEANPKAMLADLFKYLETIEKHQLFIRKRKRMIKAGRVRLMTVHRAKGLEFDYVHIAGTCDGHFGNRRSLDRLPLLPKVYLLTERPIDSVDENADERRLFYVALTRARKGVTITYSKQSETGREQLPSQFITEIRKDLIEEIDTSKFEKDFEEKKHILFSPPPDKGEVWRGLSVLDQEFVRELFEGQGFSVTALNNYLECPWNYFYSNLLRLPKAKNKHMMYGTAVHNALRDFFPQLKDRDLPKENLLRSFEFYLNKEPMNDRDLAEVFKKGKKSLSGYYDRYYKTWERNVLTEYGIRGIDIELPVHLTGQLDKLEFVDPLTDSGQAGVNVVDYKTRQPLSRNEIEKRGYKRQLVFYKLLLDNFGPSTKLGASKPKFEMVSGELDFIEPNQRGKYRKEKFIITDEEIKELKRTIARVTDEIVNLKFWNAHCGKKDCSYCGLRAVMR